MSWKKCILFCFCLVPFWSSEQLKVDSYTRWYRIANDYYELEVPTQQTDSLAVLYFQKTILLVQGNPALRDVLLDCYIKTGNVYQGQQRHTEALRYYYLVLQATQLNKNTLFEYQANLYAGSSKYSLNEIDSATYYLETAYQLAAGRRDLPDLTVLYNSLGILYFESANFGQAVNYFKLAADGLTAGDDSYDEAYVSFQNNIAACYSRLQQHRKALSIYLSLLPRGELTGSLLQNIGHTYYQLGSYDTALQYLNRVPFSKTSFHVKLLNEKARIFMQQGQLTRAEQLFDSAIWLNKQIPGFSKNKEKAYSYLYRSQLAHKQGLLSEAVTWCNLALQELHFRFRWSRAEDLPPDPEAVISPVAFFEVLKQKALLLQLQAVETKNNKYLDQALRTWLLAVQTTAYIKASFDNDEAHLFFNESNHGFYKTAALAAARLYEESGNEAYLEQYLQIAEGFKGNVLYRNVQANAARSDGLLPDSLLKKEASLKQLLAVFTTRLNQLSSTEGGVLVQKRITALQFELSRLQKSFEQYPQYNQLQHPQRGNTVSLAAIRKFLPQQTAAIQYLWCDSVLLTFTVAAGKAALVKQPITQTLQQQLAYYLSCLYNTPEGLRFAGYESAAQLYQLLCGTVSKDVQATPRWIVFPDGPLNQLPFETLIPQAGRRRWLVESTTISYHYSFLLLLNQQPYPSRSAKVFVAAPFAASGVYLQDGNLAALPFSTQETDAFSQERLLNQAATKQQFLEHAGQSELIHLATHAYAQAEEMGAAQTFIQFSHNANQTIENSRLYLHEIYNLSLRQHPLVVLSACETAAGKSTGGEGLLSLSRGFLYAGAGGIVSTLWKAEDKITAYLMARFHEYRREGFAAEQALQQARLDFLKDETMDLRFKTPNYWGHFIYIGAPARQPHQAARPGYGIALLAAIALLLLVLLVIGYKAKRFQQSETKA